MAKLFVRKKIFIIKHIQLRVTWLILTGLIIYSVILGLILLGPAVASLVTDVPPEERQAAVQAFLTVYKNFWPAIFFVFYFLITLTIFTSHKIAGPIYRFEKALKAMEEGDLCQTIQLRKGDYFFPLMNQINSLIQTLNSRLAFSRSVNEQVGAEATALLARLGKGGLSEQEIRNQVEKVVALQKGLAERLSQFRLSTEKESNR